MEVAVGSRKAGAQTRTLAMQHAGGRKRKREQWMMKG